MIALDQLIQWLLIYKYAVLIPAIVIEGPIATIIGGFLSSLDIFNFFTVYAVVVAADLTGDSLYYAAGYWGRKGFISKWGHYIGITTERVARLENHFKRHSGKTLIAGKLSHAIGGVILVAAGMARMPYWDFLRFNFFATLPKSLALLLIGFYFGEAYATLNKYVDYTALAAVALTVFFVVIYLILRKIGKSFE